ncbi:Alpha/beta hydrolase [Pseudonocardia ammonioxydans]|uniref:Alpha/beta hydrolase n=1 Tax=Pseudonocardia ammonioxydans TaxID=260086 RepID=A0A1I4XYJ2_PSUAM|nr:alpha/beta hydrolase [Pseudonocardia ammonioxydans]SFN30978.1 Alpha/beta hydrolase [Pseudonocardia ammonioxydans]
MPSLSELVASDPGAWLRRAGSWDGLAQRLGARADELDRPGSGAAPAGWQGADADRARAGRDALCRALRADAATAARAADVLGRHAGEVLAAQRRVVRAALAVHPLLDLDLRTGRIGLPGAAALLPAPWAALLAGRLALDAARYGAAVRAAVAEATRSDDAAAAALRALRPAAGPGTPGAVSPARTVPPPGPAAARAWWSGLRPDERERLVRTRPDLVGSTDGIPAADRDRANRLRLAAERARLRALVARARQADRAGDRAAGARAAAALAGLDAVHHRLAAGGAFLLDLGTGAGAGRVVLAVGDPERAEHVVTHVPGTGAGWASVPEDLRRVDATRDAATRAAVSAAAGSAAAAAPRERVAAVLWTGYDAPGDLLAAAHLGPAERGAADLRGFQEGLRGGHAGPVHLTVVGHSYGSTVTGRAAGPGFAADDVVFVGSPGAGVRSAGELGVAPERVWATTARHDPISSAPGSELFGTSRGLGPTGLAHGPNPAAPGFGARLFESAPGTALPRPDDPATPTDESAPAAAHGAYWDPGSPGLDMLGRIVSGTTDSP